MNKTFFSRALYGLAGLLLLAAPGAQAAWKDLLPDTLLPGKQYYLTLHGEVALPPGAPNTRDTMQLRGNGDIFKMVYAYPVEGLPYYFLDLPCQAKPGVYDVYTSKGALFERQATLVGNVAVLTPAITGVSKAKGMRGNNYSFILSGTGLPFGPLPTAGNFTPALSLSRLERSGAAIPLTLRYATEPYSAAFDFQVPPTADTGAYDIVLQRNDGVITRKAGGFQVFIPPAPVIQKATPDTLHQVNGGTIALTGINLEYGVAQGSFLIVDREYVKEMFLRKDSVILPAASYNYKLPVAGIYNDYQSLQAQFLPTLDMPLGSYDVGVILNGRADTSFLMQGVRLLGQGTPALVSVSPAVGGLIGFEATVRSEYLRNDLSKAAITLQKGIHVIPVNMLYGSEDFAELYFQVQLAPDTGTYDLQAVVGAQTLRMPAAVRIFPVEIGALQPPGLQAGIPAQFEFEIRYPDMRLAVDGPLGPDGTSQLFPNLSRVRLCRGAQCLTGTPGDFTYRGFQAKFALSSESETGLYDLEATTIDPARTLRKKDAVLVAPYRFAPLGPAYISPGDAYFTLTADSLFSRVVLEYPACDINAYELGKDNIPAGLAYSKGTLTWTPAKADTGVHFIMLRPTGTCQEGYYLALRVDEKHTTAVGPRAERGVKATRSVALGASGKDFRILLDRPSALEIRGTDGRLLAEYGHLTAGYHSLPMPAAAKAHGLLLFRLKQSGGDAWLRMMR